MRRSAIVVSIALLLAAMAGPVTAAGWVGLYADAGGNNPQLIQPAYTVGTMYVLVTAYEPVNGVSFKILDNLEFASSAIIIGTNYLGFAHFGDPLHGVEISFGECLTGEIHAMTIQYFSTAEIECGVLDVIAHPSAPSGNIELSLCAGGVTIAGGQSGYVRTQPVRYSTRLPADGATHVGTDAQLSWTESYCYEGIADCFGGLCSAVYFGTDPDNLTETIIPIWSSSFDPGPLAPNTTYYWRLSTWYVYDPAVWSFTTGNGPVATEESTWGRIKSLYR